MNTIGVYIGRLNPVHYGHLGVLHQMIGENTHNVLFLGTPLQKEPEKNPFSFAEREAILRKIFSEKVLKIMEKQDNPHSNLGWVLDMYKKLYENFPHTRKIRFYYGADEDLAYTVVRENLQDFCCYDIEFVKIDRQETYIECDGKRLELSATNFRKYLRAGDFQTAQYFTDARVFDDIKTLIQKV